MTTLQGTQRATSAPAQDVYMKSHGGEGTDESVSEQVSRDIFSPYKSSERGITHPGDIAEPASLAAIRLPANSYPVFESLTDGIVDSGKLSALQIEGVRYACLKHLDLLPSGQRAGFFIGDGAGVGKGRQIAGMLVQSHENHYKNGREVDCDMSF